MFPQQLLALAETLEYLDLSDNCLSELPDNFAQLKKLRILFLSNNHFHRFPTVLAQCPELTMVGFKANQIAELPDGALPAKIRWLILTDNRLEALPRSIGNHRHLQKVMLAGNQLTALPDEMAHCVNIELLRISANRLVTLPAWLVKLPKLSWLAFAGNPCSQHPEATSDLPEVHWQTLQLGQPLGQGASGVISQARWNGSSDVAVKLFKGSITSDGLPEHEMAAALAAGQHTHLVTLLGKLVGHPEQKCGLLLALLDQAFKNLAAPPSLESCTRDTYAAEATFSLVALLNITRSIAAVANHLHGRGIMHGDLYGHNILVNQATDTLLGDFGAATIYKGMADVAACSEALERLEVRAFGCLLEELLARLDRDDRACHPTPIQQLSHLQQRCVDTVVEQRPDFANIVAQLERVSVIDR